MAVSAVSMVVTAAILRDEGGGGRWATILPVFLGGALVHAGSNLWNDYADELNGADRANREWSPFNGGSRVIQDGLLAVGTIRLMALVCFAAAMALALLLAPDKGPAVPLLTLVGIGVALGYSSPPLWLGSRGLGELAVGMAFGPLLAEGTAVAISGRFSPAVFGLSLPLGLLVAAILVLNEIPDLAADRTAGKRTLAVRYGASAAIRIYRALLFGAFFLLGCFLLWAPGGGRYWLGMLALPPAFFLGRQAGRVKPTADEVFRALAGGTICLHLFLGFLLVLGALL
ncbi:MAG: prenyltransferase [Firmicutes bacterium]|nr:prenyltransferase [Bacillota bacterium]